MVNHTPASGLLSDFLQFVVHPITLVLNLTAHQCFLERGENLYAALASISVTIISGPLVVVTGHADNGRRNLWPCVAHRRAFAAGKDQEVTTWQ